MDRATGRKGDRTETVMKPRKSSGDRKVEILTAMLDLAFEVGPDNVTTGMIARRLGLTQPAIYKHFPKKEDIWRAAIDTLRDRMAQTIQQSAQAGASPVATLRRLVLGHLHLIAETPALPEIMVTRDPSDSLAEARQAIQTQMTAFRTTVTRTIESAQASGLLCARLTPEDAATLLFGIIQGLALRLIATRSAAGLVQDGARLIDLQLMLFADKGAGA